MIDGSDEFGHVDVVPGVQEEIGQILEAHTLAEVDFLPIERECSHAAVGPNISSWSRWRRCWYRPESERSKPSGGLDMFALEFDERADERLEACSFS